MLVSRLVVFCAIGALFVSTFGIPADAKSQDTKISSALLAIVRRDPTRTYDVIVRAASDRPKDERSGRAAKAVQGANGKVGHLLSIIGGTSASLTGAQIVELSRDRDVAYISADDIVTAKFDPLDAGTSLRTPAIAEVGAPSAWATYGVTGKGIGVAILDSGIAPHVDLGARLVASVDLTSGLPGEPPLVAAADPGGHGTHVAGLVAGDGTASLGAYTGVAPGASLIDVRVIGATGATTVSTLVRGMQWVLAHRTTYNIRVVNLSAGAPVSTSYSNDPLSAAAETLIVAGITVVVSAGNNGPGDSTITTPGSDPFVITVGAVDDNGTATLADDTIASWSSRGPTTLDLVAKPDVVAPGRRIVSLRSAGSTLDRDLPERQVAGTDPTSPAYFRLSGTSMAAPIVTGVVALMLERDPSLTPARVKARLMGTAVALAFGSSTTTGSGLVNAAAAVGSVDPAAFVSPLPLADGVGGTTTGSAGWQEITWEEITWETATTNVNGLNGPVSVPVD